MPKFLEKKLDKEYPNEPDAKYKIMNSLGVMRGNKETAKGRREEKKHDAKTKALEKGREITPHRATDKEVEGLPKCKICGKRATRMDFHMQEHK